MSGNDTARAEIFANIRRSLHVSADDTTRRNVAQARVAQAPRGIRPARGEGDRAQRVEMFRKQAESVAASVSIVDSATAAGQDVARFLRDHNLPSTLRIGADARLDALGLDTTAITVTRGPSAGDDLNALSHAEGGVSETGTLALVSGAHNPTTLNFLPDNHIVILRADDIAPTYEDVFERLRARYGKGVMPRTVNLVTGPSRSADIEQKLLLGAHGPRRLHIVIIAD